MNIYDKFKAEGECRMCRRRNRKLTKHRLVPGRRPWRGRYVWQNVVPLCEPCHREVEHDPGARRLLRKVLWPVEISYALARMGQYFHVMYPPSARDTVETRRREASRTAISK